MRKKHRLIIILCSLFVLIKLTQTAYGQNKFVKTSDQIIRLKKLIAAVESNPDSMKVHDDFIKAMNINDPMLPQQYAIWMKRFPKSAIVPFELGKTYQQYHDPRCKEILLKALSLNPNLAGAWEYLSYNATFVGDNTAAFEYMQHAIQADPKNAVLSFRYASMYRDGDPAKYDSLMVNVAYRFPNDEKGAAALCRLAGISFNENEKTAYYEALYRMYSKQQSPWFRAGMRDYYNYLLNTSPDKAFDLALKMVLEIKINRGDWKQKLIVARQFVEAGKLLDGNKPGEAAEILEHVNLGNSKVNGLLIDAEETLALFKAKAANACNKTKDAYDSVAMYYSKKPSDRVYQTLLTYAAKLGIDSSKVDIDIWKIRNNEAWKETDFTLENFADHKQVSLSDYRGKVVLLTYWFPDCAPCREEFLHFEAILKKYNNKNIAYLAINIQNQDDDYVMPIVKKGGYTFVPLQDDPNKRIGNLPDGKDVGAPTNFLIDQRGRVIFSDFQITDKNERTLELMISDLLKTGDTEKISP